MLLRFATELYSEARGHLVLIRAAHWAAYSGARESSLYSAVLG